MFVPPKIDHIPIHLICGVLSDLCKNPEEAKISPSLVPNLESCPFLDVIHVKRTAVFGWIKTNFNF